MAGKDSRDCSARKLSIVELTIGGESAAALAAQMAKDLGVEIDRDAAAFLAEILNGEPARIPMELEKLAAYVQWRWPDARGGCGSIVVAARKNTVWQLADMLADRKRDAALAFLDNLLREGEQPVAHRGRACVDLPEADRGARLARAYERISGGAAARHASRSGGECGAAGASHSEERPAGGTGGARRGRQPVEIVESQSSRPMEFLVAQLTMRSAA